jgi:hypothetical protein
VARVQLQSSDPEATQRHRLRLEDQVEHEAAEQTERALKRSRSAGAAPKVVANSEQKRGVERGAGRGASFVGRRIQKRFGGSIFGGAVLSVDDSEPLALYKVLHRARYLGPGSQSIDRDRYPCACIVEDPCA